MWHSSFISCLDIIWIEDDVTCFVLGINSIYTPWLFNMFIKWRCGLLYFLRSLQSLCWSKNHIVPLMASAGLSACSQEPLTGAHNQPTNTIFPPVFSWKLHLGLRNGLFPTLFSFLCFFIPFFFLSFFVVSCFHAAFSLCLFLFLLYS